MPISALNPQTLNLRPKACLHGPNRKKRRATLFDAAVKEWSYKGTTGNPVT